MRIRFEGFVDVDMDEFSDAHKLAFYESKKSCLLDIVEDELGMTLEDIAGSYKVEFKIKAE